MSRLATRYLTNRIPRAAKARIQTPPAPATPPISAASFLFCPASDSKGETMFDYHDYYHCDIFQIVKTYVNFVFLFLCSLVYVVLLSFVIASSKLIVTGFQCSFCSVNRTKKLFGPTPRHHLLNDNLPRAVNSGFLFSQWSILGCSSVSISQLVGCLILTLRYPTSEFRIPQFWEYQNRHWMDWL